MIPAPEEIARLLEPYLSAEVQTWSPPGDSAAEAGLSQVVDFEGYLPLARYLELILRWNAHTNLTAIRDPVEIIRRHFGESLFLGRHLGSSGSVLDYGSGAGFPGIPVQLLHSELAVMLGESQNKKVSFLREVIRVLGLPTQVWAGRAEAIPGRSFGSVIMRAVDDPVRALEAAARLSPNIYLLTTKGEEIRLTGALRLFRVVRSADVPAASSRIVLHLASSERST